MTAKMVSAYLTADDFQHTLLGEDEDVSRLEWEVLII